LHGWLKYGISGLKQKFGRKNALLLPVLISSTPGQGSQISGENSQLFEKLII